MYDFQYNFVNTNFDVELLFSDTDSLTYEINQMMFMKSFFLSTSIYLTLVTITKIQSFLMRLIKKLLVK